MRILLCLTLLTLQLPASLSAQNVVGGPRPAAVHVPPSYDPAVPMPLVLLLHGFPQSGSAVDGLFGLRPLADSLGFLYIVPEGKTNPCNEQYWNANTGCCANFCNAVKVDDSAYLRGLIVETRSRWNVDATRIYLIGFSAGGDMAHRMACDNGDLLAAVVSMSGATLPEPEPCPVPSPLHFLQIHGTRDQWFNGGPFGGIQFPGAVEIADIWRRRLGCSGLIENLGPVDLHQGLAGAETHLSRYSDGCAEQSVVELWVVENGEHYAGSPEMNRAMLDWLFAHTSLPVPTATYTVSPHSGPIPLEVSFDPTGSTAPPDTTIAEWRWFLGDGSSSGEVAPVHVYERPGRFPTSLTVITEDGRTATARRTVLGLPGLGGDLAPWRSSDIGAPAYTGGAAFVSEGELRVIAGGLRFFGPSDDGHIVYQEARGDFHAVARITSFRGGRSSALAGLMARSTLDPAAQMYMTMVARSGEGWRSRFQGREKDRGIFRSLGSGAEVPDLPIWLALEREGGVVRSYTSADGQSWTLLGEHQNAGLSETLLVGLAATASDTGEAVHTLFEALDVTVHGLQVELPPAPVVFRRGEVNGDGDLDISDALAVFGFLFLGTADRGCADALDADDSGLLDISDGVYTLGYLFLGGNPPPAPFGECAVDPTSDELPCSTPLSC